ncbi:DUF2490 domain-containing protein [Carboxylicivirga marina]|uniref:DUF2490 domain-containing protein n=1 Tax=Carboxylicivirga marina TaxID=2800988 RepID=UPI002592E411|nr:DUF2490 domain-containing protein [uncultured Carboxylicivirga sp.]
MTRFKAVIFHLLIMNALLAQQQDFHTWYNVTIKGELFKNVSYEIEPELRLFDNSGRLGSVLADIKLFKPIIKKNGIGIIYRYQTDFYNPDYNARIHRWGVFTRLRKKIGKLKCSYRAQLLAEYENYKTTRNGMVPQMEHRHKLAAKWEGKNWIVNPGMGVEYFFSIGSFDNHGKWKRRITLSIEHELTKNTSLLLAYKRHNKFNVSDPNVVNILLMGIEFKIK